MEITAINNSGKQVVITVHDNGRGLPDHISIENAGFGYQLVQILSMQLNGKVSIERQNGTKFILEFPFQ